MKKIVSEENRVLKFSLILNEIKGAVFKVQTMLNLTELYPESHSRPQYYEVMKLYTCIT